MADAYTQGLEGALGINQPLAGTAPGASLPTASADAERQRMQALLAQLQQQAQAGDPAALGQLGQGTTAANATAEAVGQSQPGLSRMSALGGIGNAQAANTQTGAGQEAILKAQEQQQALGETSSILGNQAAVDAQQAAAQAAAAQGLRESNVATVANNNKTIGNLVSSIPLVGGIVAPWVANSQGTGGGGGGLSKGGKVPGKPRVFGDSEANDTVPAKLSPGEIVLPRSVAQHPNAPAAAAAFVQAVKARHGAPQHLAGGGVSGDVTALPAGDVSSNPWAGPTFAPNTPGLTALINAPQAPSTQNGGLLQTGQYNDTRNAVNDNAAALQAQGLGQGPSVAPQMVTNAQDAAIQTAMQAGARPGSAAQAANIGGAGALAQQGGLKAAEAKAGETRQGVEGAANALAKQRSQDLAFAQAQQQAAWQNTMANNNISLAQQAQLRGLLGGVGQGLTAAAPIFGSSGGGSGGGGGGYGPGEDSSINSTEGDVSPTSPGDYSSDGGDAAALEEAASFFAARGGMVPGETARDDAKAKAFVAALRRQGAKPMAEGAKP